MARKNAYGKYILSAGEIGAYTVCPEAWRLNQLDEVEAEVSPRAKAGNRLHQEWAEGYEEAAYLNRHFRLIILLILLAISIYIFTH